MSEVIFTREDLRAALTEAREQAIVEVKKVAARFQKEIDRLEAENRELRKAEAGK